MKNLTVFFFILFTLNLAHASEKVLLSCSNMPFDGYSSLTITSEWVNGTPYIITYLESDEGKRIAVESYPDKKNERKNGIYKPSYHNFDVRSKDGRLQRWQFVNYKRAFKATTDTWDAIRIGGPPPSEEEIRKYPGTNNLKGQKDGRRSFANKTAFYGMDCTEDDSRSIEPQHFEIEPQHLDIVTDKPRHGEDYELDPETGIPNSWYPDKVLNK